MSPVKTQWIPPPYVMKRQVIPLLPTHTQTKSLVNKANKNDLGFYIIYVHMLFFAHRFHDNAKDLNRQEEGLMIWFQVAMYIPSERERERK